MAVREDEIAARDRGQCDAVQGHWRLSSAAFFAGVAGPLFSLHERSITPGYFGIQKSIEIVVMVTLGGLEAFSGRSGSHCAHVAAGGAAECEPEVSSIG